MKFLVTGGAGFIGSHLVDALLELNHEVVAVDNLSTGRREFLANASDHPNFHFHEVDLLKSPNQLLPLLKNIELVFHLAANADVRFGTDNPQRDLEQNVIVTSNLLECMRKSEISRIAFSSTGSVYGEPEVFPTPENAPFPRQTSFYGASKLAAEGLVSAYCTGFNFTATIFRFVSVLGERYSHGHVFDFVRQLLQQPDQLRVLGNGMQTKSYMYVGDCVNGLLTTLKQKPSSLEILNLGHDEACQVNDSITWICDELGVSPKIQYSGGERGWIGDSPRIHLDCAKIKELGWSPKLKIEEGVRRTVSYLRDNTWIFERGAQ